MSRTVLVTGGTAGIGRAIGLAFAALGDRVALTYHWGGDHQPLRDAYAELGAEPPILLCADAGSDEDTDEAVAALLDAGWAGVDVFVSNVGHAQLVRTFDDFACRGLAQSVGCSAWPVVAYPRAIHAASGRWPAYVVAISSQGARDYHVNYDAAGAAKAALETLVRYLAHRLAPHGTRVNALRPRWVRTRSMRRTVGRDFPDFVGRWSRRDQFVTPEEVADVAVALCSGWLDGMTGQIVDIDHGCAFTDNLMRLYAETR